MIFGMTREKAGETWTRAAAPAEAFFPDDGQRSCDAAHRLRVAGVLRNLLLRHSRQHQALDRTVFNGMNSSTVPRPGSFQGD